MEELDYTWSKIMKSSNSGFTLIELLISISIIAITLNLAIPTFDEIIDRSKVSANIQRLTQILQSSRLKAISTNNRVTLCPIGSNNICGNDWSTGYMSFVDNNGDRQYNDDDELLSLYYSEDEKISLSWRAFGYKNSLQWTGTGITNHQNGSFELCYDNKADKSRALFLTKAGRIRHSKDTDGDDIHENSTGGVISC